jgi:hypothetical protein
MKYDKKMRRTIENLILNKTENSNILNILNQAYPDDLKPNLNVFLFFTFHIFETNLKILFLKYLRQRKYILDRKLNEPDNLPIKIP